MSPEQWWKAGGFSGIVFVVLFVIGLVLQFDSPMVDDSGAEIKQYFIDNGTKYLLADTLIGIAFTFFFLTFIWALSGYMSAAEPAGQNWSRLILMYGTVMTAAGFAYSAFNAALAYGAADFLDENTAKAFYYAGSIGFTSGLPLLVGGLMLTVGTGIMRHGMFPQWLGWISLAVTVIGVVSSFGVLPDDPENPLMLLGLVGLLLWMVSTVALSFYMLKAETLPAPRTAT